ncbi:MAG: hypothetical protein Kow0042_21700 [Calditrichia bacterium]
MKRTFFLLILFVFLPLIYHQSCLADSPQMDKLYQAIHTGKQQIYHFHLDSALQVFRSIQQEYPDYPHGYFYESYITAIYFSQDKTNSSLDSLLNLTVQRAVSVGEVYKDNYPNDPESSYYLGVSYGILGIYHVLNRNYLKAYFNGRRGIGYLEKVVEMDSTYYDAYLGLGIFHYYVDLLPGIIKFFAGILGLHGDRLQGIREIHWTARRGQFFAVEAEFAYATIRYFLEGEQSSSLRTFQKLQHQYPQNPAVTLIIGYHYRRTGQVHKALSYFTLVPERHEDDLPQITVMKYYNIGVCYFKLNLFRKSEEVFDQIIYKPIRITPYYQSALAYYKGLLSDMLHDRGTAERYFSMIRNGKHTQYWYNISRLYEKFPLDSLMRLYVRAGNEVFVADFESAEKHIQEIRRLMADSHITPAVPYFEYLAKDLFARFEFRRRNVKESAEIYRSFIAHADEVKDDFQRAWIYIQYARVLRELREWGEAEKMLKIAESCDDEYTRLIITREKFIIKKKSSA